MSHTFLSEPADLQWLVEGHLRECTLPVFAVAEIYGNEDWPDRITIYECDHINSLTMDLYPDANGNFKCTRPRW